MTYQTVRSPLRARVLFLLALLAFAAIHIHAQTTGAKLEGTIYDAQGGNVPNATVTATNVATGEKKTVTAKDDGTYSIDGLAAGTYKLEALGNGFAVNSKANITLTEGQTQQVTLALQMSAVVQEVTVNSGIDSPAVQSAPSGGFVEERSAQSIVTNKYIENFTSPMADFGELVQIVPGAFTTSSNGIGLGQSKTYFRGFPDGDYDIDFDGIPVYDTNSPTHHSWAFFPVQWIGGVDFDRSPGSGSTYGPTPFGGSIHFLSKPLTSELDIRGGVSYGTWNSKIYDGEFNSGLFGMFGSAPKSNLYVDVHHMTSDGYQTFNYNLRSAGSILYQYQFSPKTVLTGFSGVVHLNSNGPNISSTRCMLYGVSASNAYSCTNADTANGLQPFTGAGIKFLMTNNSDPTSWFNYQYNTYQVPTDVEYVGIKSDMAKGWYLDLKGYTLNYDNGELYSNASPITEVTQAAALANPSLVPGTYVTGGKAYYDGVAITPCDVYVVKKGVSAIPCGIDKYNSYRKYGETLLVTKTFSFGVFRTGMWYEWARTNRHQLPSDPLNNWADQPLPKFNESFWTNSYQPYAEFEWHATPKLFITAGGKLSGYTFDILHHADDGSTVGLLTAACIAAPTSPCSATISDTASFLDVLPSLDLNYRIHGNFSVYGQASTGSVVPPSSIWDYNHTPSTSSPNPQLPLTPKQQHATTYQFGTVYKGQWFTLDADMYHIHFDNSYSSTTDLNPSDSTYGDSVYYLQPSSITRGAEFESTFVLRPGLNLYLNATAGTAYYSGKLNANTTSTAVTSPVFENAPGGLWVAQTPSDTEMQGLTYDKQGFDFGLFNKRIGEERLDNGAYHNQAIVPPFSTLGGYVNYTVRSHGFFDQTKIRLSGTNLLDQHNIQNDTLAGSPNLIYLNGGGTCSSPTAGNPCDAFLTNGPTAINGGDTPSLMAGRAFTVSVTLGIAPKGR
ncbi:MAG: TonB-dependent receptor [Terracidiphilus sp.]